MTVLIPVIMIYQILAILKEDNVPDVCTGFESSSSSLSGDLCAGTEITSWVDAEIEEPIKYQGKRRYINSSVFKDLQAISVKHTIICDDTIIYEVPQNNICGLDNCIGA